ncbi:MAG: hypothetical protein ACTSWD_12815 [Candidatus Heimdallarchaeota archaeon]
MSNINKITELQNKVQSNKEESIRLEEKQKALKEDKNKILAELEKLSIPENELDTRIKMMEVELEDEIEKIEKELE